MIVFNSEYHTHIGNDYDYFIKNIKSGSTFHMLYFDYKYDMTDYKSELLLPNVIVNMIIEYAIPCISFYVKIKQANLSSHLDLILYSYSNDYFGWIDFTYKRGIVQFCQSFNYMDYYESVIRPWKFEYTLTSVLQYIRGQTDPINILEERHFDAVYSDIWSMFTDWLFNKINILSS